MMNTASGGYFERLGIYGFASVEPIILAAMVTEDPLLLVGRSGTGKTYLLNSISEALGLEHRHYNASLISFDDLIGFPYPEEDKSSIRFLETPATVWGAESVLIDEISRCRPEHQNRLFSLVHERRIQGIALSRLRYRWAAMNPCTADQTSADTYTGSEPLDPALADRFAVLVKVGDWSDLTLEEQLNVANPAGEGAVSQDAGALKSALNVWRGKFLSQVKECPPSILNYARAATTALNEADIRISPRRSRLLSRTLLAVRIVTSEADEELFRQVLTCSIPHIAWGEQPPQEKVHAAHRLAWDSSMLSGCKKWVHDFHLERKLPSKVRLLIDSCPDEDTGTLAVTQLLARETPERAAAFAFAVFPAAVAGRLRIGAEGVNDLGKLAGQVLSVEGEISWQERLSEHGTAHPEMARLSRAMAKLNGARLERARQLFYWCLLNKVAVANPAKLETDLHDCVGLLGETLR